MNQIPIDKIHPSPNPIRKSWDEGKMEELAQSIKERGVIVPIKVRPNGDGYEVVYGHRRVEAARRAGLVEMSVIVEGVNDEDAIWQALIENLSNEEMTAYEKGEEINKLKEKGFSVDFQATQIGVSIGAMQNWHDYYRELKTGLSVDLQNSEMIEQVQQVKRSLGDDLKAKQAVIDKAAKEHLNYHDTRAVAEAYKEADTPELKAKVLEVNGKLGDASSILFTAKLRLGGDAIGKYREAEKLEAFQEYDQAVKDFMDAIKLFDRMIKMAQSAAKYGKFSPEGARFAQRRIDKLINELESLKEVLSDVG